MTSKTTREIGDLTLPEALDFRLFEQQAYVDKLHKQSKPLLAGGVISPMVMQSINRATDNLDAARLAQSKGEQYNALYFLTRACANAGEFVTRVTIAKKAV